MPLLEPKEVQVKTASGDERTYILSKFPAIAGREIIAKYPLSGMPKLGDYAVNEETMLKLMQYVGVPQGAAATLPLTTKALVDNHVPDWEALARIEVGMLEYNCSFFATGAALNFFNGFASNMKASITKIVTDLLAQSSAKAKPPSTS